MISNTNYLIKWIFFTLTFGLSLAKVKQNANILLETKSFVTFPVICSKDDIETFPTLATIPLHDSGEISQEKVFSKEFSAEKLSPVTLPGGITRDIIKSISVKTVTTKCSDLEGTFHSNTTPEATRKISARALPPDVTSIENTIREYHEVTNIPDETKTTGATSIKNTIVEDRKVKNIPDETTITGVDSIETNFSILDDRLTRAGKENTTHVLIKKPSEMFSCPDDNETHVNADPYNCQYDQFIRPPKEDYLKRNESIAMLDYVEKRCTLCLDWEARKNIVYRQANFTLKMLYNYFDMEEFKKQLNRMQDDNEQIIQYMSDTCIDYYEYVYKSTRIFKGVVRYCFGDWEKYEEDRVTKDEIDENMFWFWCDDERRFLDFYYQEGPGCLRDNQLLFKKCTTLYLNMEYNILDPLSLLYLRPFERFEYGVEGCKRLDEMIACLVRVAGRCPNKHRAKTLEDMLVYNLRPPIKCHTPYVTRKSLYPYKSRKHRAEEYNSIMSYTETSVTTIIGSMALAIMLL